MQKLATNSGNNMNNKFNTLAVLVHLGISGVALPVYAAENDSDDTIVVTAAQQNLQAPGVSTITADEIFQKSSVPCRVST
jgi:ferric enterobactin receptor